LAFSAFHGELLCDAAKIIEEGGLFSATLVGFLRESKYPSAAEPNYENASFENDDGHENIIEIHFSPRIST
jgi:hypothetical protein